MNTVKVPVHLRCSTTAKPDIKFRASPPKKAPHRENRCEASLARMGKVYFAIDIRRVSRLKVLVLSLTASTRRKVILLVAPY